MPGGDTLQLHAGSTVRSQRTNPSPGRVSMREYELMVVFDLAVAEAGGAEAAPQQLTSLVESRGGKVLKIDHWGRRRMAYPVGHSLDADYLVSRVELEPAHVPELEATLRINERVFRHLLVRADELPIPPPPREPRPAPVEAAVAPPTDGTAPASQDEPVAEVTAPAGGDQAPAEQSPEAETPETTPTAETEE